MVKSLGTLAFLGYFPIHTSPIIAPLTPQAKFTGNFSQSFNFVEGGGGEGEGELQENFKTDALFY